MGAGAAKPQQKKSVYRMSHGAELEITRTAYDVLKKVAWFRLLPDEKVYILSQSLEYEDFKAGTTIISQGDVGNEMYVILKGEAKVEITHPDGSIEVVARLKEKTCFGEKALRQDIPRMATVTALTPISTAKISREKFSGLNLNAWLTPPKRATLALAAAQRTGAQDATTFEKTHDDKELMRQAMQDNKHLQHLINADPSRLFGIIDCAWKQDIKQGTVLIEEGDPAAEEFYIVASGEFSATKLMADGFMELPPILPRSSFGEMALLCSVPRNCTITATQDSAVWIVDRKSFKKLFIASNAEQVNKRLDAIEQVEFFQSKSAELKRTVAEAMTEVYFEEGESIMTEGDVGLAMYILFEGEVEVSQKSQVLTTMSSTTLPILGELALVNDEPRQATVKVISEHAKCWVIEREVVKTVMQVVLDGGAEKMVREPSKQRPGQSPVCSKNDEMKRLRLIGCGSLGFVDLCVHKKTNAMYAMKIWSKQAVQGAGRQQEAWAERNISLKANSPFVMGLCQTMSDANNLIFIMELMAGGELHTIFDRQGLHGSVDHARFYAAGVVCALEHLHGKKIIHRNVRSDNVMLSAKGYPKLTDMGLAKICWGECFTTCGVPECLPPEMVQCLGYTHAADWWSFGVFLYDLMQGHSPFEAADVTSTFELISQGIGNRLPSNMKKPFKDFVKGLLQTMPSQRLPMRTGGVDNIRRATWYEGFPWEKFQRQEMEPPYTPPELPKTRSAELMNFASGRECFKPDMVPYKDDGSHWDFGFAS